MYVRQWLAPALWVGASCLYGAGCPEHLNEGRRQVASQNFVAGLAAVNECLSQEPLNSQALVLKGNLLYLMGRDSDAISVLEEVVQREPANWDARYALGRVYYFNSRPDPSCAQFEAVVKAQPTNYRAWDNYGLALEAAGHIDRAIQAHVRSIALVAKDHPEYDWAYANLSELLMKQNDNRRAFDLAVEAAQRNPNNSRNFFLAGKALIRLEQWPKAERWLVQSIKLDPNNPQPHYLLGQVYRRLGRNEEAEKERQIFKQLQDKAPDKLR